MNYFEFCKAIGTDKTSEEAENLYFSADKSGELIKPIRFELIPRYFPDLNAEITAAANDISKDSLAMRYLNFLRISYFKLKNEDIPVLSPEKNNVMRNFAPALAILEFTEGMEREMEKRGIDKVTAEKVRNVYERCLKSYKETYGFYGIRPGSYVWNKHFLTPDIFPVDYLEFQVTELPDEGTYFKNIITNEFIRLVNVTETMHAYCGYTAKGGGDADKYTELSKREYVVCLQSGDWVISIHIPRGTKLDSETCAETYKKGLEFIYTVFPEKTFKALYCASWLMNPELGEFLAENSNILSFQKTYHKFPVIALLRDPTSLSA